MAGSRFHEGYIAPIRRGDSNRSIELCRQLAAVLLEALVRGTLQQPGEVGLKGRPRLDALGPHAKADLRADVDVGGTEAVMQYVRTGSDRLLQCFHDVFIATVAQSRGSLRCRARQHAIDQRGIQAPGTKK